MKQKVVLALLNLLSICYLGGCCAPETTGSVPNKLRPQETNNWCWAAVTQMLAEHLGLSITQCALANHRFNKTNCCTEQTPGNPCPKTDDCNTAGWVDLDFAGAKSSTSETPLPWGTIKSQIYCAERPMGYAYGTPGVVGHVVVIKGYFTVGSTNYVVLNDPWSPCKGTVRWLDYNAYADPPGTDTHWDTWYGIAKK